MATIRARPPAGTSNSGGPLIIGLIVLAILAVVLILNLMATPLYFITGIALDLGYVLLNRGFEAVAGRSLPPGDPEPLISLWQFWIVSTFAILIPIVSGIVRQRAELAAGTEAIAQMIGGTRVARGTRDPVRARLLQIVDDLTKLIGLPIPKVFVMERETGINAFFAGYSADDVVLAVTRGALLRLNEEELRGILAHQLAHVANGETRLSLTLVPLLAGLVSIATVGRSLTIVERNPAAGRMLFRGPARILRSLVGNFLRIVGSIGVLFASLLKSLYARKRVFLADRGAVDITDSVDGIGGALRKIGGLARDDPQPTSLSVNLSDVLSHLFLCEIRDENELDLLPAHPELKQRIARIYFGDRDFLPAPLLSSAAAEWREPVSGAEADRIESQADEVSNGETASIEVLPEVIGIVSNARHDVLTQLAAYSLPGEITEALARPETASMVVIAVLVEEDQVLQTEVGQIRAHFGDESIARIESYRAALKRMPPGRVVSLVEQALPSLRTLEEETSRNLLEILHHLVVADGRVTFHEFLVYTALDQSLARSNRATAVDGVEYLDTLPRETGTLLSFLAYLRSPRDPEAAYTAAAIPGIYPFTPGDGIDLGQVADAIERLAQAGVSARRSLTRLATAVAFYQGVTNWESASVLRLVCLVLDEPLPAELLAGPRRPEPAAIDPESV